MQENENESSQAKKASEVAKKKLKEKQRADEQAKIDRENAIAERHHEKMEKRASARGRTYPKYTPRVLPSIEETPEVVKENTPTEKPSPVEEVVDDVVRDNARGKEALKMIALASSKGIANVSKTIGSDVISPLLSMAILTEAPILAAVFEKSLSAMKLISGGIFGMAKGFFSKKGEDTPSIPKLPSFGDESDDDNGWQISVIQNLEDINTNIEIGNEMMLGLIEGLMEGVEDFQKDMEKAARVVPNNDAFVKQESLIEEKAENGNQVLTKRESGSKPALGGFFGFINGGTLKKITSLLMKITGVSFILGLLSKITPFGKSTGGKKFAKSSKFLKGFGTKIGKLMSFIMKPLRLLAGPVMTGLRVAFMGLMGVVTAISTPILIIIAVVAAIVLGLVLLARKMGDGDIVKGFGLMWENIKTFFTNLWSTVKNGFTTMIENVSEFSSNLFTGAMETLLSAPDLITEKAMELIDFLAGIPSKVLGIIKSQVSKIPMVGAAIAGMEAATSEGGLVDRSIDGVKDTVADVFEKRGKIGSLMSSFGGVANRLNPIHAGASLGQRFFSNSDASDKSDFVSGLMTATNDNMLANSQVVNQKTEAQKQDFMKNMTKTRENNYYERVAKAAKDGKDVQINTRNSSVYNTTQVSHQRSTTFMPKPPSGGY